MVSTLPPLVADGGELRLARRVASLVYGRREVTWPEDVADPEDNLPDGREFGWVAKLDGPEPGLSERRFVRADVSIDAVENVSDVEQVLDDTALRAGGDVYFESLIEGKGLGLLKPGVDFDEGDLVDVRFWGRILEDQLVTSIDWDDDDPSVKLGGQSIRDTDSLARARAESLRLIRRERAERKDDVRALDSKATQAKDTADTAERKADDADKKAADADQKAADADSKARGAQESADAADGKAENALTDVGNVRGVLAGAGATAEDMQGQLEALNQQLQDQGEGTGQNLPLIQAYIAANTARWALQQEVDDMQNRFSDDLLEQQIEMKQEIEADRASRTERIIASAAGSSHPDYPVTARSDGSWYITLSGVKNSVLMSRVWSVTDEQQSEGGRYQRTPSTDSYTWSVAAGLWGSMEWASVPGVVKSVNEDIAKSYSLGSSSTWYSLDDVHNVEVGAAGTDNLDMKVQVGWPDSWGWYRLQIRAGSTVLADVRREGTSTLWSKNTIYTRASVKSATVPPNTTVRAYVQRWSQASSDNHRYFRVITQASWTERNV